MKQNEKILVYAVTGFLVVILMVAVVFGKEGDARSDLKPTEIGAAPSLEDLLDEKADGKRTEGADAGPAKPQDQTDPVGNRPLAANVQLLPPTPAALVTEKLGVSRQENGFRLVRARSGDTLGGLVQKWCGPIDDYLEVARAYNEELTTLRVGQEVVLPLVADEVILAAFEQRAGAPAGETTTAAPSTTAPALQGVVPAVAGGERTAPAAASAAGTTRRHTVQAGESLWKIAEREVGRRGATEYLRKLRELNPGIEAERLRIGQQILLPPGG
jgi:hypothetical protein